jgi:hypothetical protein
MSQRKIIVASLSKLTDREREREGKLREGAESGNERHYNGGGSRKQYLRF